MTEPLLPDTADTPANPPAPPPHWSGDVLASDGGVVRIRPITPDDADALATFHERLSERTRYLRYFGPYPRISPRDMYRTTHLDYRDRVGMVAVLGNDIIGVSRYELLDRTDERAAEVAFVVADEHQGRGLGSVLLEHLAGAAAEHEITTFVAEVLAENEPMITVFRDAGYQLRRSRDGAEVHLEFAIDPTEALRTVRDAREAASEARSVGNLLAPGSVAVIGATVDPARVGGAVFANLLAGGFSGPVYPVNPNRQSVQGVRSYATVRDIPDHVDLAVVAVGAPAIPSVLADCLAKGVKGLIVLTAGFGEAGPAGLTAERDLVAAARGHGMRVVGPSALGIANTDPAVGLNATLAPVLPERGRIGFFCQSGPLGAAILGEAAARNLGLSTFVSAGNRADVSGNDLLQYWDTAADTEVILLYLESFGNPRKFSRLARRVARAKPIVAVSSGRLAGGVDMDRTVVRDLFAQAGIIQVESISALFDCAALLATQPLPRGPRVAVIGNSAALNWLATDAVVAQGLSVQRPERAAGRGTTVRPTERGLNPASAAAPIDLGPEATPGDYEQAVRAALDCDHVDAVMVIVAPPVPVKMDGFADALRTAAARATKPLLTTFVAESGIPSNLAVGSPNAAPARGSIPSYPDPERAAAALAMVERYARWRDQPPSPIARPPGIDVDKARHLVTDWLADGGPRWLDDVEAARLLACYGINVVAFRVANNADEAVAAATELGYPVAVKATGEMWRQRPDLLGVRLDLWGPDAVRQAYADLVEICGDPVLHVQRMAAKGVGCVLRVTDDPSFGSVIAFGLSGRIIELLGDRAYRALPLTEAESVALIRAPRAAPLLDGADTDALVELAQRISALFDDIAELRELSVDPVLAAPTSAEVLYARVRIGPEPSRFDAGPRRLP
ncbi:bifunctional acetate--CoA ligase family protein/GNAT family N-acetyltransferase [Nocardia camponoti]|uniref:GNAT family N-acetyltransferase n=1 Tax=Nocardia camponoti TaxID=1616106 RepID=A0A917V5Q6_9NOCA|nr:bifunctional GNAT family N-acetyltransferase/acetate--CoA ligase family protein [Nocardia camponoti]GGK41329.1 GNAT family N-acetyltransferase [Nocardia camponoti]